MTERNIGDTIKDVIAGRRKIGEEWTLYDPEGRREEVVSQFERGVNAQKLLDKPGAKEDFDKILEEKNYHEMKKLMADFWLKYLEVNEKLEE